jgi:DNA repair protein RadC
VLHEGAGSASNGAAPCLPWVKVSRDPERYQGCLDQARALGPISDARQVYKLLHAQLATEDQEVFLVVLGDVRGQLRGVAEVARGQRSMVHVGPDDVMRVVLVEGAEMFVVVHNHPSGDPKPSQGDLDLTKVIRQVVAPYGPRITFCDHVVIGLGSFYSIAERKKYAA